LPRRGRTFASNAVADVFRAYPAVVRTKLLRIRSLIFEVAAATSGVGEVEETLKWGQPSYLTAQSGSGTTVRIDHVKGSDNEIAVYVSCLTDLVATFRERYPKLRYEGKRAIHFRETDMIDESALRHCIALALTYHQRKRKAAS
jgi:hypothetical protein